MQENVGGGGSEDSAGALIDAATQLGKTRGERVVVLLSDEVLQVNQRGRQALRLRETPRDGLRALGGCLGWCGTNRACKRNCFAQAVPRYARLPNQCPSYQREDACLDRAVPRCRRRSKDARPRTTTSSSWTRSPGEWSHQAHGSTFLRRQP